MSWTRRQLTGGMVAALAGCSGIGPLDPARPTETVTEGPVETQRGDITGDGADDLQLSNEQLSVQLNGADRQSLVLASGVQEADGPNRSGVIETRPHTPLDRTNKERPTVTAVTEFELRSRGGRFANYVVSRETEFPTTRVSLLVRSDVSIFAEHAFCLFLITYQNLDTRPVVIDHDDGDIHDGISLLVRTRLLGRSPFDPEYRFYLPDVGTFQYREQPVFRTFRPTPYATHFDEDVAVTYGYLNWETAPRMWVTQRGSLDMLVNPTRLDPTESARYAVVVGLHEGGDSAPAAGARFYDRVRSFLAEG